MELVGRSSSSYTRIARMFALELGVAHTFRPVFDLTSVDVTVYAGNPALKIPILVDEHGPLFGTENICRMLARDADPEDVVLRGELDHRLVANMEELVLHGLATGVTLVMAKATGGALPAKPRHSLDHTLRYLDTHVDTLIAALPVERHFSFVEVALFCLVRHLPWRDVTSVDAFTRLVAFADGFGARASARQTEYRFDQP